MKINHHTIDKFLSGETTPEETLAILAAISTNPELEEYVVMQKRQDYTHEQLEDYGSFIPAGSMAADDSRNLCDLQCEAYILNQTGTAVSEEELAGESRNNYWLKSQGTPLFNIGKLLETKGYLVQRIYDADLQAIQVALQEGNSVIAVVNGDVLDEKIPDILSEDFDLSDQPNHAIVVLSVHDKAGTITLFNPACGTTASEYDIDIFLHAWQESKNYMVSVRKKRFPEEYDPQPIDVSEVVLNPELEELTEMIAENAHDMWAKARIGEGWTFGPVRNDIMKHNPDIVPYSMLPEGEKEYDRIMAINTIKLIKRLGYRLININHLYRCPQCGEGIEPCNNFCPNCGNLLSWEDFR